MFRLCSILLERIRKCLDSLWRSFAQLSHSPAYSTFGLIDGKIVLRQWLLKAQLWLLVTLAVKFHLLLFANSWQRTRTSFDLRKPLDYLITSVPFLRLNTPLTRHICFPTSVFNYTGTPSDFDRHTTEYFNLLVNHDVKIQPHKEYPFTADGVAEAQDALAGRTVIGKLVIRVAGGDE